MIIILVSRFSYRKMIELTNLVIICCYCWRFLLMLNLYYGLICCSYCLFFSTSLIWIVAFITTLFKKLTFLCDSHWLNYPETNLFGLLLKYLILINICFRHCLPFSYSFVEEEIVCLLVNFLIV